MNSWIDIIAVAAVVALSTAYLGYKFFWKKKKGSSLCGKSSCGCSDDSSGLPPGISKSSKR